MGAAASSGIDRLWRSGAFSTSSCARRLRAHRNTRRRSTAVAYRLGSSPRLRLTSRSPDYSSMKSIDRLMIRVTSRFRVFAIMARRAHEKSRTPRHVPQANRRPILSRDVDREKTRHLRSIRFKASQANETMSRSMLSILPECGLDHIRTELGPRIFGLFDPCPLLLPVRVSQIQDIGEKSDKEKCRIGTGQPNSRDRLNRACHSMTHFQSRNFLHTGELQ